MRATLLAAFLGVLCYSNASAEETDTSKWRQLPMNVGQGQCAVCPAPKMPPGIFLAAKLCVAETGKMAKTTLLKASENEGADKAFLDTVAKWEYRPYAVNGTAVPFCYPYLWRMGR